MSHNPLFLKPACIKTMSAVEVHPNRSNQHEFNGVVQLKEMFGLGGFTRPAVFSIRGENTSTTVEVTWYDARAAHATRSEHRLYFQSNSVMKRAHEGDNIIIGFDKQGDLHIVLIPSGADSHRPDINSWEVV